jgi:type I restriction enzyme S subunit
MSFPRYPAYKPSGVEWLGQVPEHWEVLPLRRLIREVTSGTSVNAIDEPASPGQAGVLKTSCVYTGDFRPEENKAIIESELDRANCSVVAGSLIVSRMNTPDLVGAAGLVSSDNPLLFLPDRLWQVRFKDCDPQFMNYWCKSISYRSQVQLACSGTSSSMQNLSQDNFYSFIAPLPAVAEQSAIANFLGRETAKIDALVAEQQRLIELLQEKRQAVISHAVTKGLHPDATMKDSGVEWLGEVPEHWEVKALRRCFEARNNLRTPIDLATRAEIAGEYPYYGPTGVLSYIDRFVVEGEHFLIGEDGDHFLKFGRLPMTLLVTGQFNVNNHAHLLVGTKGCLAKWGALFFEHRDLQPWLIKQGVGRYKLRKEKLMEIPVLVPPLVEQEEILEFTTRIKTQVDDVARLCNLQIELLQERRSALISAAVTGQIDVRGLVPEASPA